MSHHASVFANACLKRPVDPISKMPKTAYERKDRPLTGKSSVDSNSTIISAIGVDIDGQKVKEFYRSIPDYNDINHLPEEEFYSTLKSLRDLKKIMLERSVIHVDDFNKKNIPLQRDFLSYDKDVPIVANVKHTFESTIKRKPTEQDCHTLTQNIELGDDVSKSNSLLKSAVRREKRKIIRKAKSENDNNSKTVFKPEPITGKSKILTGTEIQPSRQNSKPRRNHSSCSISWDDQNKINKDEIDRKFENFFSESCFVHDNDINDKITSRSMPSSPLRVKRSLSPSLRKRRSITLPKPFKMTQRDEDERIVNELRSLRKCFSDEMLDSKYRRKQFRARPVPIESRIPLYDKILEDQAMRRAISKINSEAELRAQMKPFRFVRREERGEGDDARGVGCERAAHALPKPRRKKRFRARPVPKNLFSNYVYDKIKDQEFYRSMNRRIRAEEMLRFSALPGTMGARDRSRLSTPAAHSDLPTDPSPLAPSATPSDRQTVRSPTKESKKNRRNSKEEFITTTPQPFRFSTADRAAKKMEDVTKRICEAKDRAVLDSDSVGVGRAFSALELRAPASGRSNLAALLRAENVRRRFEMEAARRLAEQRRRADLRVRDRQLRANPAWHLVKNNHEEDIALRLQTRRDEERMRREEFLHEMELMYGRVRQQPFQFERYYAPRSHSVPTDAIQLSPRKNAKKSTKSRVLYNSYHFNSPTASRKVSINDATGTYNGDVAGYLSKLDNDEKLFCDSVSDSLEGR